MLSVPIALIAISQAGSSTQATPKSAGFFTFEGKRYEFQNPSARLTGTVNRKLDRQTTLLVVSSPEIVLDSKVDPLRFEFKLSGIIPNYFSNKSEHSGNLGIWSDLDQNAPNLGEVRFKNLPFKEANLLESAWSVGTGEQGKPFSGTFKLTRIGLQTRDTVVLKLEFSTTLEGLNRRRTGEEKNVGRPELSPAKLYSQRDEMILKWES